MLVTFDDVARPETARRVDPADLAAVFRDGMRLEAVTLEVTKGAVREEQVEEVFGCSESVGRERSMPIPSPSLLGADLKDPKVQLRAPRAFSAKLCR